MSNYSESDYDSPNSGSWLGPAFLLALVVVVTIVLLAIYQPWNAKNDHGPATNHEQININGAQRQELRSSP